MKYIELFLAAMAFALTSPVWADFSFQDDGAALTVVENDKPVIVYRYTQVAPPEGVDASFTRSCYFHPLYGLDGDVLTQDYPDDHYHHRGVFWGWPYTAIGDRRIDIWLSQDCKQRFEGWIERRVEADKAVLALNNVWIFSDTPNEPVVRETVFVTVNAADERGRAIDFHIRLRNISDETLTIKGQETESKGYGGFNYRPDKTRPSMTIATAQGVAAEDLFEVDSPWADFSSQISDGGAFSGTALFQHPRNPDYPFRGYLLRHYGFMGHSWPHNEGRTVAPGQAIDLRYRLYVHRGTAEEAGVGGKFAEYEAANK